MARGTPDGRIENLTYATQTSDLAFISNMLWGFSPIDGKGRVWYLDTFNNGLGGFGFTNTGAALGPRLYSNASNGLGFIFCPPNSVELVTGIATGDLSQIWRQIQFGINTRVGLETSILFSSACPRYVLIVDYKPRGKNGYIGTLQLNTTRDYWQIINQAGTPVDVFAVNEGGGTPAIQTLQQIKLVCDFATGYYVRAMIGENLVDLSAHQMQASAITYHGFMTIALRARSLGVSTTQNGYLGYVLLTRDEP